MKLIAKFDCGKEVEFREIQGIEKDADVLVIRLNHICTPADIAIMEKGFTENFGKKTIVLDAKFGEILAIK